MNVAVRRASGLDAEVLPLLNADVQSLHASALPEHFKPLGPDTFPATVAHTLLVNPSNLVFIAEVDSEPAGYAYAEVVHLPPSPLRHAWDEVHLHHISVRPAYRRKSVASALLNSVRAAAGEIGISLVTLQVWTFNEDAHAFFRRQGFTPYMARLGIDKLRKLSIKVTRHSLAARGSGPSCSSTCGRPADRTCRFIILGAPAIRHGNCDTQDAVIVE